jgi:activator of HSP90 ATPase
MHYFKLFIAITCAVATMQTYGATESPVRTRAASTPTTVELPRIRTSSKELMERLRIANIEKATLPGFQLAATIESFQKNQIQPIMTNVKSASNRSIQVRYQALSSFAAQLSASRATLEDRTTSASVESTAQVVQNQLQNYRQNPGKIELVVASQHFLNIEKKCAQIISGDNR